MKLENTVPEAPAGRLAAAGRTPPFSEMAAVVQGSGVQDSCAAMALGATMYVPAVHPAIEAIATGRRYPQLKSLVLCLEDALHRADVQRGLQRVRTLLQRLSADRSGRLPGPQLFLRPRSLAMAQTITAFAGIERLAGLVIPKVEAATLPGWWRLAEAADLQLMPTLEERWVFDPVALSEFGATLAGQNPDHLLAVRIGGNDLMASMSLRRLRGRTVYDSPLAWGLAQLMCQLGSRGFALTAPVFDVLDDMTTLATECERDAEFGFVGKTAVHPSQIAVIERGFAVQAAQLELAREVLAGDADAVFRSGGMMFEPATHRAWAQRVVARAEAYGLRSAEAG